MTIQEELALSYYKDVAPIRPEHGVYLVQDIRDQKFYVKKVLTVYSIDVFSHLFKHPVKDTPKIHALVEDNGTLTVIEDYISGDTLEELLAAGPLPEERVISIAVSLCQILEDFHACTPPIVNRDIKPSNIKITPDGVVKLLDLNAAKQCTPDASRDTVLLGTQGYAAPEQYGFGASSVLTDIYALGVLMNVLLTGVFPGVRIAEGRLRPVIEKATELTPRNRFPSVRALRGALLSLLGAAPEPAVNNSWRRFLPPGFRTLRPWVWFLSALGYGLVLQVGLTLQVEEASAQVIALSRACFTGAMLAMILFSGNYLNIQSRFRLTRTPPKFLRFLGIVLIDALIFMAAVILMVLVEPLIL